MNNGYYLRVLASNEIQESNNTVLEISLLNPNPNAIIFWNEVYNDHFLDAESNWNIGGESPDPDEGNTSTLGPGEEDSSTSGPNEEDSSTTDPGEDDSSTPGPDDDDTTSAEPDDSGTTTPLPNDITTTEAPDSASTAVGYTFLIMALFSMLNELHLSVLVS